MADMQRICRRFTRFMHHGVCAVRNHGFKPKRAAWIEKLIVFYALERCRDLVVEGGNANVWCHFTLGKVPGAETEAQVRAVIDGIRGFNMKDPAATTLSEYIVDFCFSTCNLKHLFGVEPMPPDAKFWLHLAAESEMRRKKVSGTFPSSRKAAKRLRAKPAARALHASPRNRQSGHSSFPNRGMSP
jgi:hypothetical protein